MIKFEHTEVVGWEHAIRGMRNPKNSWDKSDSFWTYIEDPETLQTANFEYFVGDNDEDLMMRLSSAGPVHGKFRRMIVVYVDITAPLYWWKEFDTYKVGTVANSCSTMHKLMAKKFTLDDFSHEHLVENLSGTYCPEDWGETVAGYTVLPLTRLNHVIRDLNSIRNGYLDIKESIKMEKAWHPHDVDEQKVKELEERAKMYWQQIIQLLPSSYNQKRTIKMNYEVLANIYKYRRNHKLDEWCEFCKWIETLPHSEVITGKWEEK